MAKTFIPYKGPRIIPRCVDLVIHKECFGQKIENKYTFYYPGTPPTAAELNTLCSTFGEAEYTSLKNWTTQSMVWKSVQATDVASLTGFSGNYIYPAGRGGQNIASDLPLNVASHVTLKTAYRGHNNTGGKSFSGWSENNVDHNTLGSEILSQMLTFAAEMLRSYLSGRFYHSVASLPKIGYVGLLETIVRPAANNIITGVTIPDDHVDSASRRLTGRGT